MLRTSKPSDRVSDGSNLISTINDQEPFITEMKFEPLDARFDGSEVRSLVLRTLLQYNIPQFKIPSIYLYTVWLGF
ncbi:hypothetical protein RHMOL_Rhmol10G0207600 [Rhododendron molle]|nr:hypothetical protein RHMOL_Rhmol10G0207600 [Rhododendron molle]